MHQPGFAIQGQQLFIAHDIRDPSIDAPLHAGRQVAFDQFLTKLNKFTPIDRGLFIREDKKADLLLIHQCFDFIHDLKRIAHAVISPKFPLRAE